MTWLETRESTKKLLFENLAWLDPATGLDPVRKAGLLSRLRQLLRSLQAHRHPRQRRHRTRSAPAMGDEKQAHVPGP